MSKHKYLFEIIMIKCPNCTDGRFYPDVYCDQQNCDFSEVCKTCNGINYISINSKDEKFEEYYQKYLEDQEKIALKELQHAKENLHKSYENYRAIVKELDFIVNKG